MRKGILWVAAALAVIAIPAIFGLVALRGDDSSSSERRAAALIPEGATPGGFSLDVEGLLPVGDDREIDVMSWSWGVSNPGAAAMVSGSGAGTGKAQFDEFSFTKTVDESSPKLFLGASKGQTYPKAVLTCRKAGETPVEYMVITLENVVISSYKMGGSGSEIPTENVSLVFSKATVAYTALDESGAARAKPVQHYWDIRTAKGE